MNAMAATRNTSPDVAVAGYLREVFASPQGEGTHVGRLHLFVRLLGCAIGCRFCDTPDSLVRPTPPVGRDQGNESKGGRSAARGGQVRVHGVAAGAPGTERRLENPLLPAALSSLTAEVVARTPGIHAISITGGEPLEQTPFLVDALPLLAAQRPVLLETAGTRPDDLARVIEHVAIVSMDMKLPSVAQTAPCFDAHRRFLEIAIAKEAYVKVVVNDAVDDAELVAAARIVAEVAPEVPFFIQPETLRNGQLAASFERLTSLATQAVAAGAMDVRVLPQVHKYLRAP